MLVVVPGDWARETRMVRISRRIALVWLCFSPLTPGGGNAPRWTRKPSPTGNGTRSLPYGGQGLFAVPCGVTKRAESPRLSFPKSFGLARQSRG